MYDYFNVIFFVIVFVMGIGLGMIIQKYIEESKK